MNYLVGHEMIYNNLVNLYDKNSLPTKILLSGYKGIGKSLLVKKLLKYIYKDNTPNLIDKNSHPNIFFISKKEEKKNIEISQIREMIQFQNQSSFNNLSKIIVIDDLEYLNLNSSNALLKSLEEPNNNIFILINNIKGKLLETIKSRCIEFKLLLSSREIKIIVDKYFDNEIYNRIPSDFTNFYTSPAFVISLIKFFKDNKISYDNLNIENFIKMLINDKIYINSNFIKNNIDIFIELFFYKNINSKNKISDKLREFFYFRLNQVKKYNLDIESYLIEFEEKLLRE